ncbi:MAG: class I SAM-dependent methyltransferase [Bacteroidota bacterium]|nr:MAG: class I SAM-dependent methyltransferase [Bacteroidota bacterium]
MSCKICRNASNNQYYQVKEMMFGTREVFTYFTCSECNCLQLEDSSIDFAKYYPSDNYYSYQEIDEKRYTGFSGRCRLQSVKNSSSRGILSYFGRLFFTKDIYNILREISVTRKSSILDVGCGNGNFLYPLAEIGFQKTKGIDPFRQKKVSYQNGLLLEPIGLKEEKEKWDVIFYNHSFEHIIDPQEELNLVQQKLNKGGYCILSIPTFPNEAWERYGVNWYQIDAPRHIFLHSEKSITLLANKAGLKLSKSVYNSRSGQFLISEEYAKGYSANEMIKPSGLNKLKHKFRKIGLEIESKQLNRQKKGDQAYFILEHI